MLVKVLGVVLQKGGIGTILERLVDKEWVILTITPSVRNSLVKGR